MTAVTPAPPPAPPPAVPPAPVPEPPVPAPPDAPAWHQRWEYLLGLVGMILGALLKANVVKPGPVHDLLGWIVLTFFGGAGVAAQRSFTRAKKAPSPDQAVREIAHVAKIAHLEDKLAKAA